MDNSTNTKKSGLVRQNLPRKAGRETNFAQGEEAGRKANFSQKHFFCAAIFYFLLVKVFKLGGKKTFKWYLISENMDGQTHIRTFQPIERINPEGRIFKIIYSLAS